MNKARRSREVDEEQKEKRGEHERVERALRERDIEGNE